MIIQDYKDKKILIIGSGISGGGAKEALEEMGAQAIVFDDKHESDLPKNSGFDLIVISPSIPLSHKIYAYASENNIPLIGEIELGFRLFDGVTVAITGTNGKTTTTELVGKMLENDKKKVSICGNIGKSFALCAVRDGSEFAALEVSSFQLESIDTFKPKIACVLNISKDHLDRHSSMEQYIKTKLNIAKNQDGNDYLILSQDDIQLSALENFYPASLVYYTSVRGKVRGAYMLDEKIYFCGEYICDRNIIRLQGNHNVSNALTAICACKILGISNAAIIETLSTFESGQHRIKLAGSHSGKNFYNDSKGTNIGATIKAAESMVFPTCLILGGSDKGYEFDDLFMSLPQSVTHIFVIGQTSQKIVDAAHRHRFFEIERKETLLQAVEDSIHLDVENVLLSPACASFDMFRDYKDRGEQFEKAILELKDKC